MVKRKSSTYDVINIPSKFQLLLEYFEIIDKIYCFLVKNKLTCTLSKLKSLVPPKSISCFTITVDIALQIVIKLCPTLLEFSQGLDEIEVIYCSFTGLNKVLLNF